MEKEDEKYIKHWDIDINDSTEKLEEYEKCHNDPEGMNTVPSWVYIELARRSKVKH